MASARDWLIERRLTLAAGLAAALPVAIATVELQVDGWAPLGDHAEIAVSGWDVFTEHSPLLGPISTGFSTAVGEPTFHPGPLLFWLLAVPARLPWPATLQLTIAMVNVACVMGCVGLARRAGGRPLMFAVALAIPVTLASLPADAYTDIWNPYAPLLPFTLLIFVSWSLACGEYRLLPLAILLASFAVQCHLSYLAPAAGVLAVGIAGLLLSRRISFADRRVRRWVAAALVVGVVCWIPAAIEQATNDPGNASLIYRAVRTDQETLGLDAGWRAVVHGVGVLPWWLRDPQYGLERIVDVSEPPGALATGSTVLALIGLVVLGAVAHRRRRGDLLAAVAIGLVLCAALLVATASTPLDSFATIAYTLAWAAPAGMWVWLAAAWALVALFAGRALVARLPARLPAAAGLGAVLAVAAVVGVSGELKQKPYEQMGAIADGLEGQLPPGDSAGIVATGVPDAAFLALSLEAGVTYVLRSEGRAVTVPPLSNYLGPEYRRGGYDQVVRIDLGTPPPAGARPVARVVVEEGDRRTPVIVTVQPAARQAAGER